MDPSQPPPPGNLRVTLDRLELILASADNPVPELGRLAEPSRLDFLFRLELAAIVRSGPGGEISPHRLLTAAQRAAAAGVLPMVTPSSLRGRLRRLATRLRDAGAWDTEQPLWWSPLPVMSSMEKSWRHAGEIVEALPDDGRFDEVFATVSEGCVDPPPGGWPARWLSLPSLVPAALIHDLHEQLEMAYLAGVFDLARAGVGAGERLSSRRSDSVLYLSGLEPEVLEAAPAFAILAQWCLAHLGDHFARVFPGGIFPPRNVMLARYPAPSVGYHPHLDNPGGEHDNGRILTFVLYLNAVEHACDGGEIVVWPPGGDTTASPAAVLPAVGGSAVLFDARSVAHQVRALTAGPARWAMTLWFSDSMQSPAISQSVPEPSFTEVLLPVSDPPLPPDKVLFHQLGSEATGKITVHSAPPAKPRMGIVCTVYRGGVALDAWCEHHVALGVDHLLLIFDHLDDPLEAADAERLSARYPPDRLSVWAGSEVAAKRWSALSDEAYRGLERYARFGAACWAVAARQTLNAGVALEAARGDELGGAPLEWLLHLDADELLLLEGAGRGGATLHEHLAAARSAGLRLLRYANHELLGHELRGPSDKPRFKRSPHLAAAHLGAVGWSMLVAHLQMAQTDPRPYFTGYFNGKAAVAVAHAAAAAGVHGWKLEAEDPDTSCFLAGPSVLHCHFAEAGAFRRKYLAAEAAGEPPDPPLFEPSPVEVATFERIRELRRQSADQATVEQGLDQLFAKMTTFTSDDVELLEAAGLIFEPKLERDVLDLLLPKPP